MNIQTMPEGYNDLNNENKRFIDGMTYVMVKVLSGDLVDYKNKNMLGVLKKSIVDETVDVIRKQIYIEMCRVVEEFSGQTSTSDNRKKYIIRNDGCDDATRGSFEFSEEEYIFLKKVFGELNTHSEYVCMPRIHIIESEE